MIDQISEGNAAEETERTEVPSANDTIVIGACLLLLEIFRRQPAES